MWVLSVAVAGEMLPCSLNQFGSGSCASFFVSCHLNTLQTECRFVIVSNINRHGVGLFLQPKLGVFLCLTTQSL